MSKGSIRKRNSINKRQQYTDRCVVFLGYKLDIKENAVAYCRLHNCYLSKYNLRNKQCDIKNCQHFKRII